MKTTLRFPIALSLLALTLLLLSTTSLYRWGNVEQIALQPIGSIVDKDVMMQTKWALEMKLNKKITLLPPIPLRHRWLDQSKGIRYDAEEIIQTLNTKKYKAFDKIIGYTEADIFKYRMINKECEFASLELEDAWGVFGLGSRPGRACIVSSYRLSDAEDTTTCKRLLNVTLHEIGHTVGLQHCNNKQCVMYGNYHGMEDLDHIKGQYCLHCREKM